MRFAFTDDQLALRDAVRHLLAAECPPEVVRAAWPAPDADGQGPGAGARAEPERLDALWGHLADMGVLGLLVPEADGGMGFDEVAAAVVLAETGFAAVPMPVVEAMCVVAPLTRDAAPARGLVGWGAMALDGGRVDGALTRFGSSVAPDDRAFERAALGTAAQLIGLGRRMLELTVAYVTERHQFGVPIGSLQAVKHHLADARLALEFAAPAVWRAASSLSNNEATAQRDVSMAKAMAADAAHLVGRKALQCHGGIGYTVEYDLHLYLKRTWALEQLWGNSAWHRRRVATAIGL
jgi:alkylation response protein AidB-like acyl-CoA dehydrogenase